MIRLGQKLAIFFIFICVKMQLAFCFEIEEFRILTADRTSYLRGQITFPSSLDNNKFWPVVILKNGSGPTGREQFLDTENNLLVTRLLEEGFAVAQFDDRGVYCDHFNCAPCFQSKNPTEVIQIILTRKNVGNLANLVTEEKAKEYRELQCVLTEERINVTWDNITQDFIDIYQFVSAHSRIDSAEITTIGTSEGGVNIAKAVQSNVIHPKKLIFLSTPLSSMRRQADVSFARNDLNELKGEIQKCDQCKVGDAIKTTGTSKNKISYSYLNSSSIKKILSSTTIEQLGDETISSGKKINRIDADWDAWYRAYQHIPPESCDSSKIRLWISSSGVLRGTQNYSDVRDCDETTLLFRLKNFYGSVSIYQSVSDEIVYFDDDIKVLNDVKFNKRQNIKLHTLYSLSHGLKMKDEKFVSKELINKIIADVKSGLNEDNKYMIDAPFLIDGNREIRIPTEDHHVVSIKCLSWEDSNLRCAVTKD